MARIRPLLSEVLSDRRISTEEWTGVLAPAIASLPKRAGSDARRLLELWAAEGVAFEGQTREALSSELEQRGYPVRDFFTGEEAPRTDAPAIRAANVTEVDLEFERLRRIVRQGGVRGTPVTVAALDGGFKPQVDGISGALWANLREQRGRPGVDDDENGVVDDVLGADFVEGDATLHDNDEDTTHGLGTLAVLARGNRHVQVMAVRAYGEATADSVRRSMQYAVEGGARVVVMSFRIDEPEETAAALEVIRAHPKVLFVKSAGNEGAVLGEAALASDKALAANCEPNLAVVGAELMGELAFYSNRGEPYVTHAAPAEHLTPQSQGGYAVHSGTSAAGARLDSIAAKALDLDPSLEASDLLEVLTLTSTKSSAWSGDVKAGGVVDDSRALQLVSLRALVREGMSPASVVKALGVDAAREAELLNLLSQWTG